MRRTIITMGLAAVMLAASGAPAGATHPEPPPAADAAAPSTEDCRPGSNSDIVGPWTLMSQDEYEAMYLESRGVTADEPLPPHLVDGDIDTWGELIHRAATATWEFCDHNDDGLTCVMRQTNPSGAAWTVAFTILDNHPFPD